MLLLDLVLQLVVIGIILYFINAYVPMQAQIKKIMNIAVVVAVIIWVLKVFGFWARILTYKI